MNYSQDHPVCNIMDNYISFARKLMFELKINKPSRFSISQNETKFKCRVHNVGSITPTILGNKFEVFPEISISDGTPKIVYDLLKILLSDNNLFPYTGKTKAIVQVHNIFILKDHKYVDIALANASHDLELDKDRTKLLELLTLIILNLLLAHEAAHIADGHIGYITSKISDTKTLDDIALMHDPKRKLELQSFEVFSDTFAVSYCFENWLYFLHERNPIIPKSFLNFDYFFYLFVFSIYFLKRVITQTTSAATSFKDDSLRKHPLSATRLGMIFETLHFKYFTEKKLNFGEFQDKFTVLPTSAVESALKKVSHVQGQEFHLEFLRNELYNRLDFGCVLRDKYLSISPHLESFRTFDFSDRHIWHQKG